METSAIEETGPFMRGQILALTAAISTLADITVGHSEFALVFEQRAEQLRSMLLGIDVPDATLEGAALTQRALLQSQDS